MNFGYLLFFLLYEYFWWTLKCVPFCYYVAAAAMCIYAFLFHYICRIAVAVFVCRKCLVNQFNTYFYKHFFFN